MPFPAYLTIEGERQGLITEGNSSQESVGNKFQEDHVDEILVQGFTHQVTRGSNSQLGLTGHQPVFITKELDKSSPLLFAALTSGETLTKCELKLYRTNPQGQQEHYYTYRMHDAVLVDMRSEMPDCRAYRLESGASAPTEVIKLKYRKMEYIHETSGTFGSDYWESGHAG